MDETHSDRAGHDERALAYEAWSVDRAVLWSWIAEALDQLAVPGLDASGVHAVCARALDTHAPAVLVHAQAAGLLLERLVGRRLTTGYADRYGRPAHTYDRNGLRAIARGLARGYR